jgi:uncharacterized coiled-coil DUF342 family protein
MRDEVQAAREELDQEFQQFRKQLEEIHEALAKVEAAGPLDPVTDLLEALEDTVKKVRTGGLLGGGAKGHEKARKALLDLQGKPH